MVMLAARSTEHFEAFRNVSKRFKMEEAPRTVVSLLSLDAFRYGLMRLVAVAPNAHCSRDIRGMDKDIAVPLKARDSHQLGVRLERRPMGRCVSTSISRPVRRAISRATFARYSSSRTFRCLRAARIASHALSYAAWPWSRISFSASSLIAFADIHSPRKSINNSTTR